MGKLPSELTPLIGREQEVAELCRLLREDLLQGARLVTLTGPGGIGKTRLALAAAAAVGDAFTGGVYFVPLGALSDPNLVAPALADGVGLASRGNQPVAELLSNYLAGRPTLLVLDNFEPVIQAAPLLSELLAKSAGLKLLVTSRILLHLLAEYNYPVSPLEAPGADADPMSVGQYAAAQLFVLRVAALKSGFALNSDNAPYVAEICRRLDGLPLALELAAARISLLSPQALLARLERRLPFLTGGPHDLPERQRTLYSTIDWSYRLLSEEEQLLFNRLAVFAGSWDIPAAEAVVEATEDDGLQLNVLDALSGLADKSLLRQSEGPDGEPRFAMLDTLREYATEKLTASGEDGALRWDHANYYAELAEAGEAGLRGRKQQAWGRRLAVERDNFREALGWAVRAGEAELGLRLASALFRFWERHGSWAEGSNWLQEVLALPGGLPRTRARALAGAAFLMQYRWTSETKSIRVSWLEESRVLARTAGDLPTEAVALAVLGRVWTASKDYAAGVRLMEEGLALARTADDRWTMAWILFWIGWEARAAGHTPERLAVAEAALRESLALYEDCGDTLGRADTLVQLAALDGTRATDKAEYLAAIARLEEAVALFRELDHKPGLVRALSNLGEVARYYGDYDRAQAAYEQDLEVGRAMGIPPGVSLGNLAAVALAHGDWARAAALLHQGWPANAASARQGMLGFMLMIFGGLFAQRGQPAVAATLLAAAQAAYAAQGTTLQPPDQQVYDRALAATKRRLPEAVFMEAWARGQGMGVEQAHAFGQEQLAQPAPALPDERSGPGLISGSPEALTERELDVLRLVALGLNNREVADRLMVSPWTISAHLRSIYDKLDVRSRTAAARFAMDHKLL